MKFRRPGRSSFIRLRCALPAALTVLGVCLVPVRAALVVPQYNSLPGAHAKLFLDFDGINYSGTWAGKTPGNVPAYSTDGDVNNFSTGELNNIREIFLRVAEKYSPFNVNVTTVDPGNLNNKETTQIVIGGDGKWYNSSSPPGGVAYVGGFYNSASNIGWAFPGSLGNGYPKYVAEAAAHEAGHTFGLNHQSTWQLQNGTWKKTEEYSSNGGSSVKRPVMGVSYYSTRGLWWYGTTTGPTTYQDDLKVLDSNNNAFHYRADDHGDTLAGATPLVSDITGKVSASGIIENTSDLDLFSFVTGTGTLTFNSIVAPYGAMLDSTLQLFDSSGKLLQMNDTASLGEKLVWSVYAGTYFIGVSSHGSYGDVGQYTLTGQLIAVPEPGMAAAAMVVMALACGRRRGRGRGF